VPHGPSPTAGAHDGSNGSALSHLQPQLGGGSDTACRDTHDFGTRRHPATNMETYGATERTKAATPSPGRANARQSPSLHDARFGCPECGTDCSVYDHDEERTWRHLAGLEARVVFRRSACRSTTSRSAVRPMRMAEFRSTSVTAAAPPWTTRRVIAGGVGEPPSRHAPAGVGRTASRIRIAERSGPKYALQSRHRRSRGQDACVGRQAYGCRTPLIHIGMFACSSHHSPRRALAGFSHFFVRRW
jgi:hypothetical protein